MAFTVEDFHDLIELLGQHPEWRADLRRLVLSDDLLELPSLVRQLVEAQTRAQARLGQVEVRLDRLEATVQALAEAQARAEARLERVEARLEGVEVRLAGVEDTLQRLADAQTGAAQEIRELTAAQRRSTDEIGTLNGKMLEWDYKEHAPSYFGPIVRRLRILQSTTLADMLDDAIDDGRLTWDERASVLLADLVMSGRRPDTGQDVYLLTEISSGIRAYDVERAADRAALLERLGRPVLPVVAGREIDEGTARLAHDRGVWVTIGGSVRPPLGA